MSSRWKSCVHLKESVFIKTLADMDVRMFDSCWPWCALVISLSLSNPHIRTLLTDLLYFRDGCCGNIYGAAPWRGIAIDLNSYWGLSYLTTSMSILHTPVAVLDFIKRGRFLSQVHELYATAFFKSREVESIIDSFSIFMDEHRSLPFHAEEVMWESIPLRFMLSRWSWNDKIQRRELLNGLPSACSARQREIFTIHCRISTW